jgi:thiamine biosynthesis lipoprotein ApbE
MSVPEKTNGAFDIIVIELMGLWGVGLSPKDGIPTDKEIEKVLTSTGWEQVNFLENGIKNLNPKI